MKRNKPDRGVADRPVSPVLQVAGVAGLLQVESRKAKLRRRFVAGRDASPAERTRREIRICECELGITLIRVDKGILKKSEIRSITETAVESLLLLNSTTFHHGEKVLDYCRGGIHETKDKAVLCSCKNVTNDSTQSTDPSHESGPEVHVSEAEDEDLQLDPIFSVPPSQFEGAAACDINDKLSSLDPLQSETSDDDIDINDVYSSPAPLQVEETYYAPFQVEETDDDVLMSKRDFKILNRKLKLLLEFSESISQPPPSTQFQMSEQFYTELKSKIDNQEKMIKDEIDRLVSEWSKKFAAQDTTIKSLVDGISSIQEKSKDFGKSIDTLVEEIRETKVVYSSDMQKKLVDTKEREACSKNFLDDALGHLKFLEPNVQGLNQKWGEWVGVECLMKHNKENVEKMKATSEKQHPLENSTKDALHLKDPNVTRGKKRKSMSKVNEFATSTEVGEGTTSLQADHAVTPGVGVGESMAMNETSGSKAKLSALPQTELLKAFRCMAVESLLLMAEAAKRLESFEAKEIELKGELLGCKATVASQA